MSLLLWLERSSVASTLLMRQKLDATKATHQLLRSKSKDKVDAKPDVKAVSL
jgi:hypothetical protein